MLLRFCRRQLLQSELIPAGTLDVGYTATLAAAGSVNLTGAVYDVDCACELARQGRCMRSPPRASGRAGHSFQHACATLSSCAGGWVVGFTVGTHPVTGAVADVMINCSDGTQVNYTEVIGTPVYTAASTPLPTGYQTVKGIGGSTALVQFDGVPSGVAGQGATLDCGYGNILFGVQIQAYVFPNANGTQEAM